MNKKESYIYKDLKKAQDKKRKRLYHRILRILKDNSDLLFLTFTFNDIVLKTTNEETRKRYIKAFLNDQAQEYILNRDYGKTTEREHYHAIIKPKDNGLINYKRYKYGYLKGDKLNQLKRFTNNNKSLEEIAESLTEHATKNSTKDSKIIYSRTLKKSH